MATFVFLNQAGVLSVGDVGVPYPLFVLVSTTIWQVFGGGVTACTGSISTSAFLPEGPSVSTISILGAGVYGCCDPLAPFGYQVTESADHRCRILRASGSGSL